MVSKKQIEEYRRKNCYCAEISEQETCKKCGQELPVWKGTKCLTCQFVNGLLESTHKSDNTQNNARE